MKRFFAPHIEEGLTQILPACESKHIQRVLRAKKGDRIVLFDGQGLEGLCVIENFNRKGVVVRVEECRQVNRKIGLEIHLGLSVPKDKAFDLAIRGAVELGVSSITPLISERSHPLPSSKWGQKRERWQTIVQNACKQCEASFFPALHPICTLEFFLQEEREGLLLFGHPRDRESALIPPPQTETITLLVGPEGGFSKEEEEEIQKRGFQPFSLGSRILRVETAVVSLLAALVFWKENTESKT